MKEKEDNSNSNKSLEEVIIDLNQESISPEQVDIDQETTLEGKTEIVNDNFEEGEKPSLFNKIEEKYNALKEEMFNSKKKHEELTADRDDYKDRLQRKIAEFENYKKRTDNEKSDLIKYGGEYLIKNLLSVLDDFERSLKLIEKAQDISAVKQGVNLIYNKFSKALKDEGLEKIESVGLALDVNLHDALMQRPAENTPPLTVLEEYEAGYYYKGKVIRHAKVVVSDENSTTNENSKSGEIANKEGGSI